MDGYAHWGRRLLAGLPRDLSVRLEDLIEHQEYIEQAKAEALEEASWPETARRPNPRTRETLLKKLSSAKGESANVRTPILSHPNDQFYPRSADLMIPLQQTRSPKAGDQSQITEQELHS